VHYPLAIKAGIKQADVDAIGAGKKPKTLTEDQQIAYDFVTEVLKTSTVGDKNYDRFVKKFGERAVVDTVGILGYYYTIALMLSIDRTPVRESPVPLLKPLARPLP
jgi:4-carboxymuconolactone decarboxylase